MSAMRVVAITGLVVAGVVGLGLRRATAEPTTKPGKAEVMEIAVPRTLVSFKMVKIPAGTIEMAGTKEGEKPRKVEIKGFWMRQTEVTWDEFDVWAFGQDLLPEEKQYIIGRTRPSCLYGTPDRGFGHKGYPAMGIHSEGAQRYCNWLSHITGRTCRLPTEAEWEYAARAGDVRDQLDIAALETMAWFADNSGVLIGSPDGEKELQTHPVGLKEPNGWKLYDMLGNVGEWVVAADGARVVKGGSYKSHQNLVHYRAREPFRRGWQITDPQAPKSKWFLSDAPHVGFRVVMEE
ncbi:MAG TPA: SUMF1/EgtB/PvdO family nonheme iron enzyme [Tepidisphaeraceae bacterium]|nr:SUMF1/EgtB/PvdO family nonheme iron enzyme [Tepidisphaeraceae bacterium]